MEVDASGLLRKPMLHDGCVVSVSAENGLADIVIRDYEKRLHHFSLSGVERLRCDEFREGNIISRVLVITKSDAISNFHDRIEWLAGALHPSVQEPYVHRHKDHILALKSRVMSGELTLFYIEPSYGCELVALCSSMRVM